MLTTEASVDDLNVRLNLLKNDERCKVSTRNFRPNISVKGTKPFDEDRWLEVKIGEAKFACYRPCSRCIFTTVDPDEGILIRNMQPLRLLRSYRLAPEGKLRNFYGESPIFGVYMIIKKEGRIHVDDKVFVRYKSSPF
uniref:MOSC domain-containing protein n=1 Tax=Panagrolaimus sp. ES5 TaxID=591445 RepID=A0AC34GXP0_9BILA